MSTLEPTEAPEPAAGVFQRLLAGMVILPDEQLDEIERTTRAADGLVVLDRLPAAFRRARRAELLERMRDDRLRAAARRWRPEGGSLVLVGPTSAGKSTAAAYVFRRLLGVGVRDGGEAWELAKRMHWFSAIELANAVKEHPLGRGGAPDIVLASRAPIVFVDDVGWDRDPVTISTIFAERYDAGLPTVFTSGMTPADLTKHYGPAVVRRPNESGGKRATVVNLHPRTP
jgi:hypothetical protein